MDTEEPEWPVNVCLMEHGLTFKKMSFRDRTTFIDQLTAKVGPVVDVRVGSDGQLLVTAVSHQQQTLITNQQVVAGKYIKCWIPSKQDDPTKMAKMAIEFFDEREMGASSQCISRQKNGKESARTVYITFSEEPPQLTVMGCILHPIERPPTELLTCKKCGRIQRYPATACRSFVSDHLNQIRLCLVERDSSKFDWWCMTKGGEKERDRIIAVMHVDHKSAYKEPPPEKEDIYPPYLDSPPRRIHYQASPETSRLMRKIQALEIQMASINCRLTSEDSSVSQLEADLADTKRQTQIIEERLTQRIEEDVGSVYDYLRHTIYPMLLSLQVSSENGQHTSQVAVPHQNQTA